MQTKAILQKLSLFLSSYVSAGCSWKVVWGDHLIFSIVCYTDGNLVQKLGINTYSLEKELQFRLASSLQNRSGSINCREPNSWQSYKYGRLPGLALTDFRCEMLRSCVNSFEKYFDCLPALIFFVYTFFYLLYVKVIYFLF